jgi:AraC-like DNA-binding protein
MNITGLAEKMNCSDKTIFRFVRKYLGINPKTYLEIMRFRESLKEQNCASVNGFYDQSHFIKSVKQLTGETPKKILMDTVRNLQYKDTIDR